MKTEPTIESPCGCTLTLDQAATIRGRLNVLQRANDRGGRPRSCDCGKCPLCVARAKRQAKRVR